MAYTTILSEKKSTYGAPYCFYTVQYYEKSRSATAVTLAIRVLAHLQYAQSYNGYGLTATLTVGGSSYSIPLKGTEMWSGTATHTIDKDISVSAAASSTSLTASFAVSCSTGTSSALSTTTCSNISISRYYTAASVSAASTAIGSQVPITLSGKYPSTATCDITYKFGKLTGTVATGTTATSILWNTSSIANQLLSQIPTALSGVCTLTCITKVGTTTIGSASCNVNLKTAEKVSIRENTTTITPVNTNDFLNGKSIYVAGYSKARVAINAVAGQGATVKSYEISGLGTVGTSADWISSLLSTAGEKTVTITVTDSRNTTASVKRQINVMEYKIPSITLSAERGKRINGKWESNVNGENLKIAVNSSVALTEQGNRGKTYIKIDGVDEFESEWITGGETICYVEREIPDNVLHTVTAVMTDLMGNSSAESVFEIPTAIVNMSMRPNDEGVTFGGHPVQEGLVSEFPAKFNNNVYLNLEAAGFDKTFAEKCNADENGMVAIKELLLNIIYPVGSYYWSSENTNPKDLFGGTWEKIEGKFVLASSISYATGSSGGSATVALTTSNMPSHTHSVTGTAASAGGHWHQIGADLDATYSTSGTRSYSIHGNTSGAGYVKGYTTTTGSHTHTVTGKAAAAGSGAAHNNMPPYIVANCWRRTA